LLLFRNSAQIFSKSNEEESGVNLSNQDYEISDFYNENLCLEENVRRQITKTSQLIIVPSFFSLNASIFTYLIIALTTR
jgi:hypothetical protein